MKIRQLIMGLSLFVTVIMPTAILAHDDGLTCHTHPAPTPHSEWIDVLSFGDADIDRIVHRFDNSIGEQPQLYAPQDVRKVRRAFSEIREAVGIVAGLVARADRNGREDTRKIESLARELHTALNLNQFVAYEALISSVRTTKIVVLDQQNIKSYLTLELGVSDSLIVLLDQAAQSCG